MYKHSDLIINNDYFYFYVKNATLEREFNNHYKIYGNFYVINWDDIPIGLDVNISVKKHKKILWTIPFYFWEKQTVNTKQTDLIKEWVKHTLPYFYDENHIEYGDAYAVTSVLSRPRFVLTDRESIIVDSSNISFGRRCEVIWENTHKWGHWNNVEYFLS